MTEPAPDTGDTPQPTEPPRPLIDWSRNAPYLALLLLLALFIQLAIGPGYPGQLVDHYTDSFTYMVRLTETDWWSNRGWSDFYNAPDGFILHWTYPFSAFVTALAVPFWTFLPWKEAVFFAGTISSFISLLGMAVIAYYLARLVNTRGWAFAAALVILGSHPIITYGAFGRPDHHIMGLALVGGFWLCLAYIERFNTTLGQPSDSDITITKGQMLALNALAGVIAATALWTTPESMAGLVLGLGLQCWHRVIVAHHDQALTGPDPRVKGDFLLGLAWIGMSVIALHLDPPYEGLWAAAHDRFSIVHVVFAACTGLLIIGRGPLLQNAVTSDDNNFVNLLIRLGCLGMISVGVFVLLYPTAGSGAMNHVAPVLKTWLGSINEMQPTIKLLDVYIRLTTPLLGLFGLMLFYDRHDTKNHDSLTLLAIGAFATLFLLTIVGAFFYRFLYFSILAAVPFVGLLLKSWSNPNAKIFKPEIVLALLLGGPILALQIDAALEKDQEYSYVLYANAEAEYQANTNIASLTEQPNGQARCSTFPMVDHMAETVPQLAATDAALIAMFYQNPAPALAFHTGMRMVSAPYHRNTQGLLDERIVYGTVGLNGVYEVIDRRGVDVIGVCIQALIEEPDLTWPGVYAWARDGGDERFAPMLIIEGEWVVLARQELLGDWAPVIKAPEITGDRSDNAAN